MDRISLIESLKTISEIRVRNYARGGKKNYKSLGLKTQTDLIKLSNKEIRNYKRCAYSSNSYHKRYDIYIHEKNISLILKTHLIKQITLDNTWQKIEDSSTLEKKGA